MLDWFRGTIRCIVNGIPSEEMFQSDVLKDMELYAAVTLSRWRSVELLPWSSYETELRELFCNPRKREEIEAMKIE